jgi:hypothetical protein
VTASSEQPPQQQPLRGKAARVARYQREADEDYRGGEAAREGSDRADALRREMWGTP